MSRSIDFDGPLSEDEILYLKDRNRDHLIPTDSPSEDDQVEPDVGNEEAPEESTDAAEDESDEGEVGGEFGSMKVEELKALLTARDLPTDGKKAELITRLESADVES